MEAKLRATEEQLKTRAHLEQDAEDGVNQARRRALESISDERSSIEEGLREELKLVNARLSVAMQSLKIAETKLGAPIDPDAPENSQVVEPSPALSSVQSSGVGSREGPAIEETSKAFSDMDVCLWTIEQQLKFVNETEEGSERDLPSVQKIVELMSSEDSPPSITEALVHGIRAMAMVAKATEGNPHSNTLAESSKQLVDSIQRLWAKSVLARNQVQQWGKWLLELHNSAGTTLASQSTILASQSTGGASDFFDAPVSKGMGTGDPHYPIPGAAASWGNSYGLSQGMSSSVGGARNPNLMQLDENTIRVASGGSMGAAGAFPQEIPGGGSGRGALPSTSGERRGSLSDEASKIVSSFLKKPRPSATSTIGQRDRYY